MCSCCVCGCLTKLACKLISLAITIFIIILVITLVLTLVPSKDNEIDTETTNRYGGIFRSAAVTANGQECAAIGSEILRKNGSAADAAIATLFCDGVACSQCMGLGGGFLLTVYKRATGQVRVLDAREVAPLLAHKDMFEGGDISSTIGGMAVAVPGELRGYEALYNEYGTLPWADLIQPTIDLCREGYIVTEYLARVLRERRARILAEPSMREIFINPETNDVWLEGDKIKRPKLAETLEIIAREGVNALYNGSLTKGFLDDIKSFNGIITAEDMNNYKPTWLEPLSIDLGVDHTMHTVPLPGSGHLLSLIFNTLRGWTVPEDIDSLRKMDIDENSVEYWHRTVEVFKYAYAKRTGLGDPKFLQFEKFEELLKNMSSIEYAHYLRTLISDDRTYDNYEHYGTQFGLIEDHGTAHVSVLAPNGDAIAATSTINFIFGAFIRSMSTGIILNNEMDDFSFPDITNIYNMPPSPTNFPEPGKTPLSSMTPSIVVQKGRGARLIVGAAGGTRIPTQVGLVTLRHLFSGEPLKKAIDSPRIHHQLFPMEIQHEHDFDAQILDELRAIGHRTSIVGGTSGFASITGIAVNRETGNIEAEYDHRRLGSADGF